jgi:hypothetical protein
VHEREPTLEQKHLVHDIVDMTSYIEVICETIQRVFKSWYKTQMRLLEISIAT